MFCDACGNQLTETGSFCAHCGKAVGRATVSAAPRGRVDGNLQLLGILWVAIGVFRLFPGFIMFALVSRAMMPDAVPMFVRGMFPVLGGFFSIFAVASIVTAVGLLTRQPWGRMLAIVFGGLNLVDIPFGTAIGVYTLWVLLPQEAEREYRQIAIS
jgi:hypothetical protein